MVWFGWLVGVEYSLPSSCFPFPIFWAVFFIDSDLWLPVTVFEVFVFIWFFIEVTIRLAGNSFSGVWFS